MALRAAVFTMIQHSKSVAITKTSMFVYQIPSYSQ